MDDVSFYVRKGETLGIVGESGCGKSTMGRLLMRLIKLSAGSIRFEDQQINTMTNKELRMLRKIIQTSGF